ncbi:Outer membrane protein TolC [Desulfacinum hydrothermale DSM 13146]|uniref:Outer membrane protein TolC n=1 Tax=Desulfacinum hydrothermale DSM 13146 TaxID=1121390 RepID=A0A1W1XEL7_9BACT|nr:TolC family protein [Desulfacinum hydrothermale]SMC22327.1 Outer membrane protein TolC [Desulfacinum hydrothermale DSM 13146]
MKDGQDGNRKKSRKYPPPARWAWVLIAAVLAGCAGSGRVPELAGGWSDLTQLEAALPGHLDSSQEESALPERPTLQDYLTYAALHNPGLRAAFDDWKAALWKIPQVRSLPDPRFTYAYLVERVETRVGPQRQKFALAQTFPWLSKLELRGDVAVREARARRALYEAAKWKLFEKVKKAYYEYAYLRRAVAVTEENVRLLKHLERAVQTRYAVSLTPYGVLVRLQTELARLEDRLKTLRDLRNPISAALNAALNRSADAPLPWPDPVRLEPLAAKDEEILTWLLEGNPELKALSHRVDKEKAATELARQNYYPDVTVRVEAVDTGQALNPATPDSGKDPVAVGVSLNLPIWWEKYDAGVREARSRRRAAEGSLKEKQNQLSAQLAMVLYNLRDAERRVDLYKNGLIPKAQQALQVSLQDFEADLAGYLDVIDAQRTLLEFELAYERAEADRAQRLAEVERLVGRFLAKAPSRPAATADAAVWKVETPKEARRNEG